MYCTFEILCPKKFKLIIFQNKAIYLIIQTVCKMLRVILRGILRTRDSTHEGLYSKCPDYNYFTRGKYCVFPRGEKYLSNPRALAREFERYFSTRGNTQYFTRVKDLYKGHFEYNPEGVEARVELQQ